LFFVFVILKMATSGSAEVQVVPGPEATWTGQKTQGIVSSRSHTIVYPKNGGKFVQGNKTRFEIPSQDYWDTSLFTISFRLKLFSGAGAAAAVARTATQPPAIFGIPSQPGADPMNSSESHWLTHKNGVQSLINRVRILQGSAVVADVQNYGKLNRLLKLSSTTSEHQKYVDFVNEGVYDPEDWEQKKEARNFCASATINENEGRYYNIMINTGFLEIDKYFPTKYTGQLTFELYWEANDVCLISSRVGAFSDGAFPTVPAATPVLTNTLSYPNGYYEVDDMQAHVHFVVPINEYDEEMLSTIENQGLTVMYDTWTEHTRQITSTGRTVHSFQERAVSVRGGLCVMENELDISAKDTEFQFSGNNMNRFQWKLGNTYIPAQPVECQHGPGRAVAELQDFLNVTGDPTHSWLIRGPNFLTTNQNKTTANVIATEGTVNTARKTWEAYLEMRHGNTLPNQFIMALNLEKSPGQLSGFNTSATNVDIELRLDLGSQNLLENMPDNGRGTDQNAVWAVNNAGHTFQPSKVKCHDITGSGGSYYAQNQPDNRTYNGEGHGRFYYNANENSFELGYTADTPPVFTPAAPQTGRVAGLKPKNRFPESVLGPGAGIHRGGITSTSFMYTKEPHKYSLLTFWANVDAQMNIIRVGQMEILR
jgi:hypothetical protein